VAWRTADQTPTKANRPMQTGFLKEEGSATSAQPGLAQAMSPAPQGMAAQLLQLQAAFPAFRFRIRLGRRGRVFEAWRDPADGALYAVLTADPCEMWHELQIASRTGHQDTESDCPDCV
jgi:hypothetical protein